MTNRRGIAMITAGTIILAVLASSGWGGRGQPAAAQSVAQATPQPQAAKATQPDAYRATFLASFAAHLGLSEDQVNQAFMAALTDTTNQAVRDGALTQQQAEAIREKAAAAGILMAFPEPSLQTSLDKSFNDPLPAMTEAIAALLNLSADDLKMQMAAGKSISDLAIAQNIPEQQLRDTALGALRSQLDQGVQSGRWTQAEADEVYRVYTLKGVAGWLHSHSQPSPEDRSNPKYRLSLVMPKVEQAEAAKLGIPVSEMKQALDQGQTLAELAAAHNVPLQELKDTILTTLRTELNSGVQSNLWTQAEADESYGFLANSIDVFVSQTWGGYNRK